LLALLLAFFWGGEFFKLEIPSNLSAEQNCILEAFLEVALFRSR
jgi:hypothetical protein